MYCEETGHTPAPLVLRANRVARAFRRNHEYVEIVPWLDQPEMNVESVCECEGRPRLEIPGQMVVIEFGLQFVRRQNHDDISPRRRVGRCHDLEPGILRLRGAG